MHARRLEAYVEAKARMWACVFEDVLVYMRL